MVSLAQEYAGQVPEEEWERVPEDLCEQLDHYVYGLPKQGRAA